MEEASSGLLQEGKHRRHGECSKGHVVRLGLLSTACVFHPYGAVLPDGRVSQEVNNEYNQRNAVYHKFIGDLWLPNGSAACPRHSCSMSGGHPVRLLFCP